jgi:hypothetical protein
MNKAEKMIKELKTQLNILDVSGSSSRHPLCKGDGIDHCGYYTTIDCDECKYGGGRKNPEAKCNQNYR